MNKTYLGGPTCKFEKLSKALSLYSTNISYYVSRSTGRVVSSDMNHSGCQGPDGGRSGEGLLIEYGVSFWSDANILGFPGGSGSVESTCSAGDLGLIPGSGISPGEGHGNPLQCSCLENPMDSYGYLESQRIRHE